MIWFSTSQNLLVRGMNPLNLSTFREEVEEFFDSMDRDFDGRLSFEEFMGEESPIEKLFKNMDKNGDGLVTKQVWYLENFYADLQTFKGIFSPKLSVAFSLQVKLFWREAKVFLK